MRDQVSIITALWMLINELMNEARTMSNSVSIVDNEIFLPVNDELELKVAYKSSDQYKEVVDSNTTSPSSCMSTSLSSSQSAKAGVPENVINSYQSFDHEVNNNNQYKDGNGENNTDEDDLARSLDRTASILRCAMQLLQHRRYRQNIKERTDSFFKSSRPGGGRGAGSFGQIHQTLQQRPTAVLSATLQALQYYSFSRRIREVLAKTTRNLRQSWWEPIYVHSIDVRSPPTTTATIVASPNDPSVAATTAAGLSIMSSNIKAIPSSGMGCAVSILLGSKTAAVRFVLRSHPAPCVIPQLSDRPSAPIMHVAEFERVLEQELASRAICRICDVLNSVQVWSSAVPQMRNVKFVIDIDQRCVGVFKLPSKSSDPAVATPGLATV
ncbi:hypothetical protein EDD11_005600 [Mortierella claussenii]|nr:hypothetical protein EDD11_005600 [Mortierella claussenii]